MTRSDPLVSIGVPVYNDAPWLRNSLDHVLAQDYTNLEIILADDGSTDGSREICREYALRDSRIRLFENKHNLGNLSNHRFVFDVSTGDYFAWGSGHDYYHVSFISKTLEHLQRHPLSVMCFTQSNFVDESGVVLRETKGGLDMYGLPPAKRFRKIMEHLTSGGTANAFYGLYRHEILGSKDFLRESGGWDIILLGEMSLLGEITQVNQILYYRVLNRKENRNEHSARHTEMLFSTSAYQLDKIFYHFIASLEFFNMAMNSGLGSREVQSILEDIVDLDVNLSKRAIMDELSQMTNIIALNMDYWENYPLMRQYKSAQILKIVEQARLLDFSVEELLSAKPSIFEIWGINAESYSHTAVEEFQHGFLPADKKRLGVHNLKSIVRRIMRVMGWN